MTKYRDELIQTIKAMGQELIDRAESMVHEDCDMITNFNISIDIPQPMDGFPELTWSTSAISKNFYNMQFGHSAGDAKMDIHAETVTVKKKDPAKKDIETCHRCKWRVNYNECSKHITCRGCPHLNPASKVCKCGSIPVGDLCPYFEEWEGPTK